jgi:hypothetical protein
LGGGGIDQIEAWMRAHGPKERKLTDEKVVTIEFDPEPVIDKLNAALPAGWGLGLCITFALLFGIGYLSGHSTARVVTVMTNDVTPDVTQTRGYANYRPHPDGRD